MNTSQLDKDIDYDNNNLRTPISGINVGVVALPKIDIKKVNEASRSKSLLKGASSLLETHQKSTLLTKDKIVQIEKTPKLMGNTGN